MEEMMDLTPRKLQEQSTIFSNFHISEYIYIHLVCVLCVVFICREATIYVPTSI